MDHRDHVGLLREGVEGGGLNWADLGSGQGAFTLALADLLGPTGSIHTTELKHGLPLKDQLIGEVTAAKTAGERVLMYEYAKGAIACVEFDRTLPDYEMQSALRSVRLVRVDVAEFTPSELSALGMGKPAYPWFYKLDASARPTDAISADEWDANTAENMAPVLGEFARGVLGSRRSPSPMGTAL